jgi:alkylation response protein AidB-like acyl-CoA dehydrogenase
MTGDGGTLDAGPYTHAALLEAARALAPQIEAASSRFDEDRRLPDSLVNAIKGAGLYRMLVPRSVGGAELNLREFSEVIEELARSDGSVAWTVSQNSGICRMAACLPPQGRREVFGSPDMVVSWGNGPSSATKVPGGYRVTGRWVTASGIHHAVYTGAHGAPMVDAQGAPVLEADGSQKRVTLFFPTADIAIEDVWFVSGLRATGSDTYSVTDLFVPEHRAAFEEPLEPGTLYLFGTTNIFALGFASVALGIARGTLDAFRDLAISKSPRGISGPLSGQQFAQISLAEVEAEWRALRAYLHGTADECWATVDRTRDFDLETRINLRLATTYVMQRAAGVVDTAYRLAGTTAIFTDQAFERRFRDMHAVTQHIQARDDHYERVGRYLLGLEPDPGWL